MLEKMQNIEKHTEKHCYQKHKMVNYYTNFLLQQPLCAFFLQRNTKWKTDYSACTGIGYSSLLLIKCET